MALISMAAPGLSRRQLSNQETKFSYKPEADDKAPWGTRMQRLVWGTRNRKMITSAAGAGGTSVSVFMILLLVFSPEAMLIQDSHLLQKPFGSQSSALEQRLSAAISHLDGAPSSISATRLGTLAQFYLKPITASLTKAGITFTENNSGGLGGVTIDPDKLAKASAFDNTASIEDQKAWISKNLANSSISPDDVIQNSDGSFSISGDYELANSIAKGVIRGSTRTASGSVIGALNARVLEKAYDVPTLLHPERFISKAARQRIGTSAAEADSEAEAAAVGEDVGPEASNFSVTELIGKLRGEVNSFAGTTAGSVTTGALVLQDAYCEAFGAVNDVISFNRLAIVVPAALEAVRLIAVGEQIESGQDVSTQEVDQVASSTFDSKGLGLTDSEPYQVNAGGENPSQYPDIPADYSQAFSSSTTAATLAAVLGGYGISKLACSFVGKAIGAVVGLVLLVGAVFTEGGTLSLELVAKAGITAAVTAGAMIALQDIVETTLKDNAAIPRALSGPLGGSIAAYGAREAANITATTEGGVALNNTQSQQVDAQTNQQDQRDFASESFFSRVFNINDYRSVLGRIADYVSPHISVNLSNIASDILNVGHIFSSAFSGIFKRTSAATPSYNWNFPEFGTPPSLLNSTDPTLQDPYTNASLVLPLLQNDTDSVIQRAETCFGDSINNSSGTLDVDPIANFDVNPDGYDSIGGQAGPSYASGNCNDASPNWQRIMLFVTDTRAMEGEACYMGDSTSCTNTGA